MTLSKIDSLRNGRGIWKVRAMPRWQIAAGTSPAISRPSKRIEPAFGLSAPAIRLKIVLLPDPFGPIRPRISPARRSKPTSLTAVKPPKRLVRPSTSSTGARASGRVKGRLPGGAPATPALPREGGGRQSVAGPDRIPSPLAGDGPGWGAIRVRPRTRRRGRPAAAAPDRWSGSGSARRSWSRRRCTASRPARSARSGRPWARPADRT